MQKKKIVVTNRVFPETRALLEAHAQLVVNPDETPWTPEQLRDHCRDAFGLMAFMTDSIGADFLAACPQLHVIGAALKGYDNIDIEAVVISGGRPLPQNQIEPDRIKSKTDRIKRVGST